MQRPEVSDQAIIDAILEGKTGMEIAQTYGFTDATVIYRVRRSTGKSPSELRAEHGWAGTRIPPSEVDKIVDLYLRQHDESDQPTTRPTLASVARATGHTPDTIRAILKSRNIPIGGPGYRSFFSAEQKEKIADLYRGGASCPELAGKYGVNEITIRRTLKMMGVPRRPRGRPPVKRETPI